MKAGVEPYTSEYIRSQNAQMLIELRESFDNRNNREVKETSQVAIRRNLQFITSIARVTGPYDPLRAYENRYNVMPREFSQHLPTEWHDVTWQSGSLLVLLVSRLERYEMDFSGISTPLDALLQPSLPESVPPPHLYSPLNPDNSAVDSDAPLDRTALAALWFETFFWLQKLLETDRASWPEELELAARYYLFFRAMREQESGFTETHPKLRRFESVERLFRALVFAHAALKIETDFELLLLHARLHRKIGLSLQDCGHLRTARDLLLDQLRTLDITGTDTEVDPRCGSDCPCGTIAPRIPRLLNDLGRIVETYGDVLQSHSGSSLVVEIDDAAQAARRVVEKSQKNPPADAGGAIPKTKALLPRTVAERVTVLWDFLGGDASAAKRETEPCRVNADFLKEATTSLDSVLTDWNDRLGGKPWLERWFGSGSRKDMRNLTNPLTSRQASEAAYELAGTIYGLVRSSDSMYLVAGLERHAASCSARCHDSGNPREAIPVHNKGRMSAKLGKLTDAVEEYREALSLNSEYAQAHENLALALLQLDECSIAERHFSAARDLYERRSNLRTGSLEANLGEIVAAQHDAAAELRRYLQQDSCIKRSERGDGYRSPDPASVQLAILKRWNSFTPALPSKTPSVGGGYFLAFGEMGIAVDPGYGFLRNLAKHGFSLSDIDCIAISHLHLDHIADLENLLLLLFERQKRAEAQHRRVWILAKGCPGGGDSVSLRLQHRLRALISGKGLWDFLRIIELPHVHESNVAYRILEPPSSMTTKWTTRPGRKHLPRQFGGLDIRVTSAHHFISDPQEQAQDSGDASSGFVFAYRNGGDDGPTCRIGFTGDTRWWIPDRDQHGEDEEDRSPRGSALCTPLPREFEGCDVLIAHLGSVYTGDIDAAGRVRDLLDSEGKTRCPEAGDDTDRNHLGLSGIYSLVASMPADGRPTALLLGEYGEEMGRHRLRVAQKLRDAFSHAGIDTSCMTADLGLRVQVGPDLAPPPEVAEVADQDADASGAGTEGASVPQRLAVRVHCRFCGSKNWQPFHNAHELFVEGDGVREGKVVYHCSRHHRDHVIDSVRRGTQRAD